MAAEPPSDMTLLNIPAFICGQYDVDVKTGTYVNTYLGRTISFYSLKNDTHLATVEVPELLRKIRLVGNICWFDCLEGSGSCSVEGLIEFKKNPSKTLWFNNGCLLELDGDELWFVGPSLRTRIPSMFADDVWMEPQVTPDFTALLFRSKEATIIFELATAKQTVIDLIMPTFTVAPLTRSRFCVLDSGDRNSPILLISASDSLARVVRTYFYTHTFIADPTNDNRIIVRRSELIDREFVTIISAVELDGTVVWEKTFENRSQLIPIDGAHLFAVSTPRFTYIVEYRTGQLVRTVRVSKVCRWLMIGGRAFACSSGENPQFIDLITSWSEDTFLQQTHKDGLRAFHHVAIVLPICKDLLGVVMQFHGRL
jgi:hypothetical protein